jgi:hypothetical protein
MPHAVTPRTAIILGLALCLAVRSHGAQGDGDLVTVVSSKVDDSYVRSKLANGSYAPEYYAYANGGHWSGTVSDASIDKLAFMDVARTIAAPLQSQNYLPTRDPKATNLLVVVYWGRTRTPEHANDSVATQNLQGAQGKAADAHSLADHQFSADSTGLAPAGIIPCVRYHATADPDATLADNGVSGALATSAAEDRSRDQMNAMNASLLGYNSSSTTGTS